MQNESTHGKQVQAARRASISRGVSSVLTGGQPSKRFKRTKGSLSKDMDQLAKDARKTFRGFGDA
ncbi:MAG: hypothetical protein M0P31_17060 [Solirubrobacteraceae bacterium]|nr:hypothetical protein [Solirubrobacteraceae bacterium]